MNSIQVSDAVYRWLKQKADQSDQTPNQVADALLRRELIPNHAHIEVTDRFSGPQAIIKGTNISVSLIIGYLRVGETPESIANEVLPHLTLAQVYDALSYYYDNQEEIELELAENSEEKARAYLREHLGEERYLQLTGKSK